MARTQFRSMARPRRHGYDKLALILLGAFIVVAIIAALVAFNLVKNLVQGWVSTPLMAYPISPNPLRLTHKAHRSR